MTISCTTGSTPRASIAASVRSRTVGEVLARAVGVEQLDLAAHGARRLEGVVARGELGVQQRLAGEAVHEPEVLVGRDVRRGPTPAGS